MLSKAEYYLQEGFERAICTKEYTFKTKAINLETGTEFIKKFKIERGTKGTVFQEKDRIMIRLDDPMIAANESKAPYESKLYRVFLYDKADLDKWTNIIY